MREYEQRRTNSAASKRATLKKAALSEPLNLFDLTISQQVLALVPRSFAKQYNVFPIEKKAIV